MRHILAILLVCTAATISAQNVGIGTKEPKSKLHIAGDIRIDSLVGKDSGAVLYDRNGALLRTGDLSMKLERMLKVWNS